TDGPPPPSASPTLPAPLADAAWANAPIHRASCGALLPPTPDRDGPRGAGWRADQGGPRGRLVRLIGFAYESRVPTRDVSTPPATPHKGCTAQHAWCGRLRQIGVVAFRSASSGVMRDITRLIRSQLHPPGASQRRMRQIDLSRILTNFAKLRR